MQSRPRRANLLCRGGFEWWLHRLNDSSSTFSSSSDSPCFAPLGHYFRSVSGSVGLSLLVLPRRPIEPIVLVRPFAFDDPRPPALFFGPFQSFQTTLVPAQSRIIAKPATGPPCGGRRPASAGLLLIRTVAPCGDNSLLSRRSTKIVVVVLLPRRCVVGQNQRPWIGSDGSGQFLLCTKTDARRRTVVRYVSLPKTEPNKS
jgi:hypothetical protein